MAGAWDDPYVNFLVNEPMYSGQPSYDEDLLDTEGDWLTEAKKGASLGADISYAAMNNTLDPRVFQPISSYEPVDARGYRTLQNWKAGTPYQQYVADRLEQHWSPAQIRAELESMQVDPAQWGGDPEVAQSILNELPRRYDKSFNDPNSPLVPTKDPDFGSVDRDVQNLSDMIMSDPEFTVGPDGSPVKVKSEDSPMTEKFRSLGYYSTPADTYDPYEFAPEGVTPESDAALQDAFKRAIVGSSFANVQNQQATKGSGQAGMAMSKWLREGSPKFTADAAADFAVNRTPQQQAQVVQSDPSRPKNAGDWGTVVPDATSYLPDAPEDIFYQQGGKDPVGSKWPSRQEEATKNRKGINPMVAQIANRAVTGAMQKKNRAAKDLAKKAKTNAYQQKQALMDASDAAWLAKRAQQQRQALVAHLTANGRTPFQAEVNARRGGVYGGF